MSQYEQILILFAIIVLLPYLLLATYLILKQFPLIPITLEILSVFGVMQIVVFETCKKK